MVNLLRISLRCETCLDIQETRSKQRYAGFNQSSGCEQRACIYVQKSLGVLLPIIKRNGVRARSVFPLPQVSL